MVWTGTRLTIMAEFSLSFRGAIFNYGAWDEILHPDPQVAFFHRCSGRELWIKNPPRFTPRLEDIFLCRAYSRFAEWRIPPESFNSRMPEACGATSPDEQGDFFVPFFGAAHEKRMKKTQTSRARGWLRCSSSACGRASRRTIRTTTTFCVRCTTRVWRRRCWR